jgi:hypothetical protein
MVKVTTAAIREAHLNLFEDLVDVCIEQFNNAKGIVYYKVFALKFWANLDANTLAMLASVGKTKKEFLDVFTDAITIR